MNTARFLKEAGELDYELLYDNGSFRGIEMAQGRVVYRYYFTAYNTGHEVGRSLW